MKRTVLASLSVLLVLLVINAGMTEDPPTLIVAADCTSHPLLRETADGS